MKETVDDRIGLAKEYLARVRRRKVAELPPSVLMRELAETRRQLGQVLDVLGEQAPALTEAQRRTVLDALDVAAEYKRDRAAECGECTAQTCGTCTWRLEQAAEYEALSARLRGGAR